MAEKIGVKKFLFYIIVFAVIAGILYMARGLLSGAITIHQLLTENKQLKKAISLLTQEEQIGYAKLVSQENRDGKIFTTIRFVETARDDKTKKVLEKDYAIEGDIVHFDALIVKFTDQMVVDGKARAMYLWRRIYGERTPPENAFPIEQAGKEPDRYKGLLKFLPSRDRNVFWTSIWDLANDPEKLASYGIKAVYGNVVYSKPKKGSIYVFKITSTGQIYLDVVPEM